jgi:uncharacterized RDD family membrane protein YckC
MNLDNVPSTKKNSASVDFDLDEFDFRPITSGLGFSHQQKTTTEIKPAFAERQVVRETPVVARPKAAPKKEMNVYQNDLSIFYGDSQQTAPVVPMPEPKREKVYRTASRTDRSVAYILDLGILGSVLSVMLTFMSRALGMNIMEAWAQYPNEITPLILTLFSGFYLLYFSISEKTGATMGKAMMNIRVVNTENRSQDFMSLVLRTLITLTNFASLGLFSYFDLQNKATSSKVIKAD